jgi:hypothetical protein
VWASDDDDTFVRTPLKELTACALTLCERWQLMRWPRPTNMGHFLTAKEAADLQQGNVAVIRQRHR